MKVAGVLFAAAGLLWTFYAALGLPAMYLRQAADMLQAVAIQAWATRLAIIGLAVAILGLLLVAWDRSE